MTRSFLKWLKFNFTNTQTRLLLILTIAVFMIIIAVGMTTYYSSKSVLQQELSEPQHQMLRISMNDIDEVIRESDQMAVKVALNGNVYKFLTDDEQGSYRNITELVQFLETMISSTTYIKSAYIYDIGRESMVAFPQGYSSSTANFPDSDWTGVAAELEDRPMLVKKRQMPAGSEQAVAQITLFRKIVITGQMKGIIAVNFKTEQMFEHMLLSSVSHLDSHRFILDTDHRPLYDLGNYPIGPEAAGRVIAQLGGEQLGEYRHDGKLLLASQIISPFTGWSFLSVISQDSLLAHSQKIRDVVIAVSLAALAAGAITIACYNAAAFRPVRRMRQLLSDYDREGISPELIDLEKITGQLLTDHARQALHLRQTLPEASSKFLTDIYAGNMSGKRELSEKWNRYCKEWSEEPLAVAMLSVDDYPSWCTRFTKSDHSLLKFAITNIIAELLSGQWRVLSADLGRDRMLVMLQPLVAAASGRAAAAIGETLEIIPRLLKFQVSAGLSGYHTGGVRLEQAMFEAENALGYRLYRGYGRVITFEEISENLLLEDSSGEHRVIAKLTEAVEAGSGEEALKVVDKMISHIRAEQWHPAAAVTFFEAVADKLERIRQTLEAEGCGIEMSSLRTLHLDAVAALLRHQVAVLAECFGSLLQSKDFILCQQMIQYMNNHLEDPVGIQEIADHTHISISLASQLFKQEMNETIHGYFTKLRMERACELLLDTDYKISEIASMVGYQHENSFIRVYRKYKDITPGKYREMMRSRRESLLNS